MEDENLWGDFTDEDLNDCLATFKDIEDACEPIGIPKSAPLHSLRYGKIWVSDLVAQVWCEQRLFYEITSPVPEDEITESIPIINGQSIHLARELEVQDRVPIKTASREDNFAIKIINIITCLKGFLEHGVAVFREIPIFGIPFNCGVLITGIIDELRFDQETFQIDIVELKTRTSLKTMSFSQKTQHELQIMIYKTLFDDLIRQKTTKEVIASHLRLNLSSILGEDVLKHISIYNENLNNLDKLFDKMYSLGAATPFVSQLIIEYYHQHDSTSKFEQVQFNPEWLENNINQSLKFWKGEREPEGVILKDTWKCNMCPYNDTCEWRIKKHQEILLRNSPVKK